MKAIKEPIANPPKSWPRLMRGKSTGTIYLAHKAKDATEYHDTVVLVPGSPYQNVGTMKSYHTSMLEDYYGRAVLEND